MKLTFRTVSGSTFNLEIEPEKTIGDLKQAVVVEKNIELSSLKLVYKGKVLSDDAATVASTGFEESSFIVVFIAKPAAAPKAPEPAAAAPAPAAAPAAPAPAPTPTPTAPAPAAAPTSEAPAAPAAPGGLLTGSNLEAAISNLCEMGFERNEVVACMRAAFNNPERAVEYLTTGIPPGLMAVAQAPPAPAAANPAPAAGAAAAAAPAPAAGPVAQPFNMFGGPVPAPAAPGAAAPGGGGGGGGGGALDFLRQNPQIRMLRQVVRQNPGMLAPLLQEIGRANPFAVEMIQNNQAEFLRFMQEEGGGDEDMEALAGMMGGEGEDEMDDETMMAMMGGAGGAGAGAGGAGGVVIQLTQEDMDKVERLQALGFQRDACIEALLACDKNEELAANFLAEQMFD